MKKTKNKKQITYIIVFQKYAKFASVLLGHFNKYIPLTSKEGHSTIVIGRYFAPDISEGLFHSEKKIKIRLYLL